MKRQPLSHSECLYTRFCVSGIGLNVYPIPFIVLQLYRLHEGGEGRDGQLLRVHESLR